MGIQNQYDSKISGIAIRLKFKLEIHSHPKKRMGLRLAQPQSPTLPYVQTHTVSINYIIQNIFFSIKKIFFFFFYLNLKALVWIIENR